MKKKFGFGMFIISMGLLAFIITLTKFDYYDEKMESNEISPIRFDNSREYVESASSIMINPKSIEAIKEEKVETKSKKEKVKKNVENNGKDETYIKPIDGELLEKFSENELVYSDTLKEWSVHNGVDIGAKVGEKVNSVCDGEIKNIIYDCKYGNVIEMKSGEYSVKYSCVEPLESLKIGDKVKRGQQIAIISDEMGFELDNGAHLHLEIIKDNKQINPSDVISNL